MAAADPLQAQFNKYATKTDATKKKAATLSEVTKWMKANKVFKTSFTSNHLDICWAKHAVKKDGNILNFDAVKNKILPLCAEKYKVDHKCADVDAALNALIAELSKDVASKGASTANKSVTDRLTDTSKYTGAHKERFDESGKGKGKDGREERVDNTGYVGNYKGQDTFDKKH